MNAELVRDPIDTSCKNDNDALEERVERRLAGRVRNFRLLVRANGMILQGQASSFHVKQLAQHALMKATSAPILANEIEVATAADEEHLWAQGPATQWAFA
jgi:hypothetical protein